MSTPQEHLPDDELEYEPEYPIDRIDMLDAALSRYLVYEQDGSEINVVDALLLLKDSIDKSQELLLNHNEALLKCINTNSKCLHKLAEAISGSSGLAKPSN
jgi:hypothetical protein